MSSSPPHREHDIPDDLPKVSAAEARAFARLIGLIRRLRAPDGCPWDREQTLRTMTPYLIEEAYEVMDAVEKNSSTALREELGDLIFLLFFCAEMTREGSNVPLDEILEDHVRKMIGRHPHVFGDAGKLGVGAAAKQWEEIKQQEKEERESVLDGRLPALPALTAAYRIQEKTSAVGFDWQRAEEVLDKIEEELGELRAALRERPATPGVPGPVAKRSREELGDLFFALVNLSRFLRVDPEASLRGACQRFMTRFRHVETRLKAAGKTPAGASLEEMDALWDEAKSLET